MSVQASLGYDNNDDNSNDDNNNDGNSKCHPRRASDRYLLNKLERAVFRQSLVFCFFVFFVFPLGARFMPLVPVLTNGVSRRGQRRAPIPLFVCYGNTSSITRYVLRAEIGHCGSLNSELLCGSYFCCGQNLAWFCGVGYHPPMIEKYHGSLVS